MDKSISIDRIAYILTRSHVAPVLRPKLFGYSLKRRIRSLFLYGPRLPQDPLEHAPPASLFLSSQCQSAAEPRGSQFSHPSPQAQKPPGPLLRTPGSHASLSAFGRKARSTTSAASLSDGVYMAATPELSTPENVKSSKKR